MKYATLYIMDPSLVGSKVLDTIPQIKSYSSKNENDNATGMLIKLDEFEIEMNFMEPEKLEDHLEGFKGLAYNYVSEGIDPVYVLTRIFNVRLVIGCVIEPDFDKESKVLEFFKNFNSAYKSLLFYDNKVFDYDMQVLAKL
ncbi:hypothetical protein [Spirobacillus cienkowskii]|uniref:hypothetical protein n=1 Tax=Spirobacillus cienkowskii TaxID=495820 RepID=UPI0030D41908